MRPLTRRPFLTGAASLFAGGAGAAETANLALPGGPSARPFTTAFPQKGSMILQRTMAPLLETPFHVFDQGTYTPNDLFYVRWHWPTFPTEIDPAAFRLNVHGAVRRPLSLSLAALARLPQVELAAVNQCSGNSRGFTQPRVVGAQWGHGAMGNALWRGVRLRDVLEQAGLAKTATAVRFAGLDEAAVPDAPRFRKSLALDHANDADVLIATSMNGADLPLLNGFPARLVVPGWYSTYWVKMLSDIEVLDKPDDDYWMATAYRIPDTPAGDIAPGAKGFPTRPIGRMVPRSFVTSHQDGARVKLNGPLKLRGIAFGGDCGVASVETSMDSGKTWQATQLEPEHGTYGFRRWATVVRMQRGPHTLAVRCTNTQGIAQPARSVWNPGGYMHNGIEQISVEAA